MTVRRVMNMLSSRFHAALGAQSACRVAPARVTAAAAPRVPEGRITPSGLTFKRTLVVSASLGWRDASALAASLEKKHGVHRHAVDVTAAANRRPPAGGNKGTKPKNTTTPQKGNAKTNDTQHPGRKGVGPPARTKRGGKKQEPDIAFTAAQQGGTDDFETQTDVDDELSAFNDDDTGDYDPKQKNFEKKTDTDTKKKPIASNFNDDDEDDFRVASKSTRVGDALTSTETEDAREFVFIQDEDDADDDEFLDDDGLFLTDADDSLTKRTASQAKGVSVKSCRYLQSCVRVKDCPPPKHPEIAVIGRSNVGKSSLINMLTGRTKKEVAKTSKNPGKTQTINHFEMVTGDGTWYLTDLPGYGFANAPERARKQWALFTREYLLERENLLAVMLLIDSTIKPQQLDLECLEFLGTCVGLSQIIDDLCSHTRPAKGRLYLCLFSHTHGLTRLTLCFTHRKAKTTFPSPWFSPRLTRSGKSAPENARGRRKTWRAFAEKFPSTGRKCRR